MECVLTHGLEETQLENAIETLNTHVEKIIVKRNSQTINALERLRIMYLGKLELIAIQIKRAEENMLNDISKEFEESIPIDIVVKKPRGRPRKVFPVIMPQVINDVVIDTYETQVEPIIADAECIDSEFSIE